MQEAIETKTEIVRDPAITAAIREIKARIKELADSQRTGKKAFREAQSKWDKASTHMWNEQVPIWHDQSDAATALFVIYGELRQTKRPHFKTPEAYDKYFNAIGIGWKRQAALKAARAWLKENHPNAYVKQSEVS